MNEVVQPYNAAKTTPKALPKTQAEARLRQVLNDQSAKAVLQAVKQHGEALRRAVRATTALRLAGETVPIEVIDGLPGPLAEATNEFEPWQWWLIIHRPVLEQATVGLKVVVDQRNMIESFLGEATGALGAVSVSRRFLERILAHSVEQDFLARFQKIDEDVFGAYWSKASKIQIYWMPLAIFAPILGASLSTLTVVILCHELVHAYTHRGVDLNKRSWPLDRFVNTNLYVKEGLAQYYTERIMRGWRAHMPDGLATFLDMTKHLSSPYTTYQNWLGDQKQPSLEATRFAMLEFRNAKPAVYSHQEFLAMLETAQAQIHGGSNE